MQTEAIVGRWDLTIKTNSGNYPGWFEITKEDNKLHGRMVWRLGSVVPLENITFSQGIFHFSPQLPIAIEKVAKENLHYQLPLFYQGKLIGKNLQGTTNGPNGAIEEWEATPAPKLLIKGKINFGKPIQLFSGEDLDDWSLYNITPSQNKKSNWEVKQGKLVITDDAGVELKTNRQFKNFALHAEVKLPPQGNSGIFLRSRYEVQLLDSADQPLSNTSMGAIYGFLKPKLNAALPAGQWQTLDITLIGRTVTVIVNGKTVLKDAEIPGITGGAIDSNEQAPGPIMLQGSEPTARGIEFRNLVLTPITVS